MNGLSGAEAPHLRYEQFREVNPYAGVVLARNPSPMTLEGTNTWLLRQPGELSAVVVDPGPEDETHLRTVQEAAGRVALILLTHAHHDHSAGARRLHELTGAQVRSLDPAFRHGTEGLRGGDMVHVGDVEISVVATPGHTADSLSFVLDAGPELELGRNRDEQRTRCVLTGDTILGRGTTVVAEPDGDLAQYLASLRRLQALGADTMVLPGHGPELANAGAVAAHYLQHRRQRLEQIRSARAELGADADARQIVELVYADVDPALWWAAEMSVRAQLTYLRNAG